MAAIQGDLLARTGQVWKLKLLPLSIVVGSVLMLCADWFQHVVSRPCFLFLLFGGIAVDVAGLLIPAVSICCPRCHSRWLWALYRREQVHKWYRIMRNLARCPKCGFYG